MSASAPVPASSSRPRGSLLSDHGGRLPELFGRDTAFLGWQGITLSMPRDWHLAAFGGDYFKGNLRVVDDTGARMEIVWEQPKSTPDVARSVTMLLKNIEREAKRKKHQFETLDNPKLLSRIRREHSDKDQLTNFGWIGDKEQPVAHGFGAAWHCPKSDRVIVVHFLGRGNESPDKTRRLAGEILGSCSTHAEGGWQFWSVFDLQLEVPEEFHLVGAKLQTGRLEFDWERLQKPDMTAFLAPKNWGRRPERIGLRRLSAANVVLENESLEDWSRRVAAHIFKPFRLGKPEVREVLSRDGYAMKATLKDLRREVRARFCDLLLRRPNSLAEALVWQDEEANKIFVLLTALRNENAHVRGDVLNSIASQ